MATLSYKDAEAASCPDCSAEFPASLLACPKCGRLVHGDRLKEIASGATDAENESRHSDALVLWREALDLLPPRSKQHKRISDKCSYLSGLVDEAPPPVGPAAAPAGGTHEHGSGKGKGVLAGLGSAGLLLWKFKWIGTFLLTKAKFLFLGLKQGGTFLSMAAAFGVYWTIWGWPFALGVVLSIYVHEMGHVAALRRYGIGASAPMFIPGFGAFIRLKQHLTSVREDARVGLAGPEWGLGATLVCYAVYWTIGGPIWGAVAKFSAWINLFNLVPVWQLDGSRGLGALSMSQRKMLVAVIAATWFATGEGMLLIVGLVTLLRSFGKEEVQPHWSIFWRFAVFIVALSVLATVEITGFEHLLGED